MHLKLTSLFYVTRSQSVDNCIFSHNAAHCTCNPISQINIDPWQALQLPQ